MDKNTTPLTGKDDRTPILGMGTLIGIGAGLGVILGILFENLVLGLSIGAALGTVIGAVAESRRKEHRPTAPRTPKQES